MVPWTHVPKAWQNTAQTSPSHVLLGCGRWFLGARYAEIMAERERANTSGFVKKKVGVAEVEASHTLSLLTL